MCGMEQEISKPEGEPRRKSQAFSTVGCFLAAAGATLLVLSKTSAAMGMAMRSWAQGWSVGIYQFVKSASWRTGSLGARQRTR